MRQNKIENDFFVSDPLWVQNSWWIPENPGESVPSLRLFMVAQSKHVVAVEVKKVESIAECPPGGDTRTGVHQTGKSTNWNIDGIANRLPLSNSQCRYQKRRAPKCLATLFISGAVKCVWSDRSDKCRCGSRSENYSSTKVWKNDETSFNKK